VIVNEVLTDTDPPVQDAIELYNPTAAAVDLGGWYLSDSAANYRLYRIPAGTTIAPGGYLVFNEQTLGFSLDSDGDDVWLMQSNPATGRLTRFVDRVEFGAARDGESLGRWPNGSADASFYPMASTTAGAANSGPRVGPVVINEIMYAPAADGQEFIELRNLTGADVSLAGWQFTAGIDYTFPAGAVIPANGYLLLVGGDTGDFRAANAVPDEVPVYGPYTIGGFLNVLDNAGERLVLSRPGVAGVGGKVPMFEVDRVRYDSTTPWPVLPADGGSSIARRNSATWGDTPLNWGAESDGGSPGTANFGGVTIASVVGRHVFYNRSSYDNNDAAANAADDGAIATDKQAMAWAPGGAAATFANVTSYTRGLNGLMIDIAGRAAGAGVPLPGDFQFRVGEGDVSTWQTLAAGAAPTVTVRPGAGVNGSDRVTLTFADGAIKNTWLQVLVLPGPRTGLLAPDVFYFGNLIGDTGDGTTTNRVNALDLGAVKRALNGASAIDGRYDFNRDGRINALDLGAVKANLNRVMGFITPPPPPPGAAAAQPAASAPRVWDETAPDLLG
jgi:hypothetical protein